MESQHHVAPERLLRAAPSGMARAVGPVSRVGFVRVLAMLILSLYAAPVNAQAVDRPTMFLVMGGDMLALGELTHSEAGIQQGSAREANPLLGGHTNRGGTARRWVLKSAGQAISTYAILRTSRTDPDDPHRRRKIWMARSAAIAKVVFNGYILRRALDYQGDGRDPAKD